MCVGGESDCFDQCEDFPRDLTRGREIGEEGIYDEIWQAEKGELAGRPVLIRVVPLREAADEPGRNRVRPPLPRAHW